MEKRFEGMACPCCGQNAHAPTIDVVIQSCEISEFQARILEAVWRGKGRAVPTQRIFDAMYADDPNGGPGIETMYKYFKFGLNRLRQKLKGSGVWIENAGYGKGYRLVIGENAMKGNE